MQRFYDFCDVFDGELRHEALKKNVVLVGINRN
jgi:hypothetical protein